MRPRSLTADLHLNTDNEHCCSTEHRCFQQRLNDASGDDLSNITSVPQRRNTGEQQYNTSYKLYILLVIFAFTLSIKDLKKSASFWCSRLIAVRLNIKFICRNIFRILNNRIFLSLTKKIFF